MIEKVGQVKGSQFSHDRRDESFNRFYRIALRSATECAAILDVCNILITQHTPLLASGENLLLRVVSMLTKMAKNFNPGTGTGTGT